MTHGDEGGQRDQGPADQGQGHLQGGEHGGILARAGAHDAAEELEDRRNEAGKDLRDPQAEPYDLEPGEEPDDPNAADAGSPGRRGTDDDGDGDDQGDGDDEDHVPRDEGELEHLLVHLPHPVQGGLLSFSVALGLAIVVLDRLLHPPPGKASMAAAVLLRSAAFAHRGPRLVRVGRGLGRADRRQRDIGGRTLHRSVVGGLARSQRDEAVARETSAA